MQTIAVVSEKGGSGKTTVACHVAGGLAARGKRVLLIDFDHQANASLAFNVGKGSDIYRFLVNGEHWNTCFDWPLQATYNCGETFETDTLCLARSDSNTAFLAEVLSPQRLGERLESVRPHFDICVIDTNPTIGDAMALVYNAADSAIITTTPSAWALAGLVSTWQHMQNAGVPLLGVAVTQYHRNWSVQKRLVRELREHCKTAGWRLFSPIYNSVAWQEAPVIQKLVWHVPFPNPRPANQAWKLVEEVEEALGE